MMASAITVSLHSVVSAPSCVLYKQNKNVASGYYQDIWSMKYLYNALHHTHQLRRVVQASLAAHDHGFL